jgi:hypothetical protein
MTAQDRAIFSWRHNILHNDSQPYDIQHTVYLRRWPPAGVTKIICCVLEFSHSAESCNAEQACAIQINGTIDGTVILVPSKLHFFVPV